MGSHCICNNRILPWLKDIITQEVYSKKNSLFMVYTVYFDIDKMHEFHIDIRPIIRCKDCSSVGGWWVRWIDVIEEEA